MESETDESCWCPECGEQSGSFVVGIRCESEHCGGQLIDSKRIDGKTIPRITPAMTDRLLELLLEHIAIMPSHRAVIAKWAKAENKKG